MLNLNKFCSLFIGLILSVVCALPLSARDINVRGTVTNIEGEPLFRVSIYNAGTNKLIGSTNEDGKYLVKIDSEGELLCLQCHSGTDDFSRTFGFRWERVCHYSGTYVRL